MILAACGRLWIKLRIAGRGCGQIRIGLALVVLAGIGLGACDDSAPAKPAPEPVPAARVITLTPSATEIVAALGATGSLVGVDRYSTYPAAVDDLPEVGDFLHPSFDAILRLSPDLVIADNVQAKVVEGLAAAGIRTLVFPMQDVGDVRRALTAVGAALGKDAAARRVIADIDAHLGAARDRARRRAAAGLPAPRVLAVVDREHGGLGGLVACGPDSYLDGLLAVIGADNALATSGRYARISPEGILAARPDIIIDTTHGATAAGATAAYAPLGEVPAVRNRRIVVLSAPYFVAPGPRVTAAVSGLEKVLYGK